jgi:hypothetical protein
MGRYRVRVLPPRPDFPRVSLPHEGDHGGNPLIRPSAQSYRDVDELLVERGFEVDHLLTFW